MARGGLGAARTGLASLLFSTGWQGPLSGRHGNRSERRASVSVNGEVLAGSLDPRALQFVREWASLRRDEIMANWERARRNEQLLAIEPLA